MSDCQAAAVVRQWLERVSTAEFSEIQFEYYYSEEEDGGGPPPELDLAGREDVIRIDTEEEEIFYKDGSKYLGQLEGNLPHGCGHLLHTNGRIIQGTFDHGMWSDKFPW